MNKKVLIGIVVVIVIIGAIIGGMFLFKHEHIEEILPAVPPTCQSEGFTEGKKCSDCGKIIVAQQPVEKLPHKEVVDAAVAPTCVSTGWTEGKHCSVCNEILVSQRKVEKLPHKEVVDAAVAPTCVSTGWTEGKHCSVCNEILVSQQMVDMIAHTIVIDEAVQPDCYNYGLTEGSHCSVCYTVFEEQEWLEPEHYAPYGICYDCNTVVDEASAINEYVSIRSNAMNYYFKTYYDGDLHAKYHFYEYDLEIMISNTYDGKIMIMVYVDLHSELIDCGPYYRGTGFVSYEVTANGSTIEDGYTSVSYNAASIYWSTTINSIDYVDFVLYLGDYDL